LLVLNLRSSFFYAVADAYKRWRDLSELEVLNLLLSSKKL
ncbi:MAG: phosphoribosyltransferase, partial [Thermoprotei archaeon]